MKEQAQKARGRRALPHEDVRGGRRDVRLPGGLTPSRRDRRALLPDCNEAEVVDELVNGIRGVLPHALDPDDARRLWDVSEQLVAPARAHA
jgi:hypothetical protein